MKSRHRQLQIPMDVFGSVRAKTARPFETREHKMLNLKAVAIAAALSFTGAAFAQTATPGIDQRQANQEKRIQQGVKSGELTKREAARLEKREGKLQADKQKAAADGKVTKKEREQLNREANRDSKAIYRQKHDAQKAK
jgi:CRISPR/Cas system-associated endoribonuclease Cas2